MFELKLENKFGSVVNIDDGINYMVEDIEGLTPPEATIFTSKSPNKKGSKYNGSTIGERYVLITIALLGDIEESRNKLYEWVESEEYVKIYYQNDTKSIYCEGYVVVPEIDMYSPKETVQLSIICPDPYLKDLNDIVTEISNLIGIFTFPFAIEEEGIPFSEIKESVTTNIYNSGAETGVQIRVNFFGDVTEFSIMNANNTLEKIKFKKSYTFNNGDILIIDTDNSPKKIIVHKSDGTTDNILKHVEGKPYWLRLKRGNNLFTYTSSANTNIEVSISFKNKYLGV